MHDTAREAGRAFFETYGGSTGGVLDVGSLDINGTLRPFVPSGMNYYGVDLSGGPNVSIILDDPYSFPFGDGAFDLVVSTSCLEHDEFFWLTFVEMARVLKFGGHLYVNAPVGGVVHRHPVDCWRFYPDAGLALARWARRNGHELTLLESFVNSPGLEGWMDFVAVWQKDDGKVGTSGRIVDRFPNAIHKVLHHA